MELLVVCFDLEVEGTAAARNSRRTVVKGKTGNPGETSAKLTSDVRAAIVAKGRQVLAIGQDADVT